MRPADREQRPSTPSSPFRLIRADRDGAASRVLPQLDEAALRVLNEFCESGQRQILLSATLHYTQLRSRIEVPQRITLVSAAAGKRAASLDLLERAHAIAVESLVIKSPNSLLFTQNRWRDNSAGMSVLARLRRWAAGQYVVHAQPQRDHQDFRELRRETRIVGDVELVAQYARMTRLGNLWVDLYAPGLAK